MWLSQIILALKMCSLIEQEQICVRSQNHIGANYIPLAELWSLNKYMSLIRTSSWLTSSYNPPLYEWAWQVFTQQWVNTPIFVTAGAYCLAPKYNQQITEAWSINARKKNNIYLYIDNKEVASKRVRKIAGKGTIRPKDEIQNKGKENEKYWIVK